MSSYEHVTLLLTWRVSSPAHTDQLLFHPGRLLNFYWLLELLSNQQNLTEVLRLRECSANRKAGLTAKWSGVNSLYTTSTWNDIDVFMWALFQVVNFSVFLWTRSLQNKAERLCWSGSLLLHTEAALIADHSRKQIHCRDGLYMTTLQKTPTIPLMCCSSVSVPAVSTRSRWAQSLGSDWLCVLMNDPSEHLTVWGQTRENISLKWGRVHPELLRQGGT